MKKALFLCLSVLAAAAVGEDLVTKSGKTYKDYSISGCNETGVSILHESGAATVSLAEWPLDRLEEVEQYRAKIAAKQQAAPAAKAVTSAKAAPAPTRKAPAAVAPAPNSPAAPARDKSKDRGKTAPAKAKK